MLRSLLSCAALTAATLTLGAPAAQAQTQTRQYDGYCYVNSEDMQDNAGAARCMNGEYYAYTDSYRAAPRAPDGYQVEYFTHRPSRDVYDQVYNASTLTANFDPGASNHFGRGDGNGYAYNDDNGQYNTGQYNNTRSDNGYNGDRPYDQSDNPPSYQPGYNPDQPYDRDVQPGAVDNRQTGGWRDDRGQWHVGQPSAVGWRDESGRWHVGQVAAYGWQDDQGQWHENAPNNGGGY